MDTRNGGKNYAYCSRYVTKRDRRRNRRKLLRNLMIILILSVIFFMVLSGKIIPDGWSLNVYSSQHNVSMKELHSSSAILVDLKSGRMIAGKKPDMRIYPASMTKIMTAIIAIRSIPDLNRQITVPGDFYPYLNRMDASMAGFEPGETAYAKDFIYGALLPSGAECCLTLADYISGSESDFVDLMNQKARELGMKHTHFEDATGLQNRAHYTTVKDMSVLLQYALRNKEFKKIFESQTYTIEATNKHPDGFTIHSTMFQDMHNAGIQGGEILGGKTGYTDEAGLCLASLADVGGHRYILVTAHAKGSPETPPYHIEDAVDIYRQLKKT